MSIDPGRGPTNDGRPDARPPGPNAPRRNWLRRIIEQGPGPRRRLGEAVAGLLGVVLASLTAIVFLAIWHLVRRGRLIRERLAPPRPVRWPEPAFPAPDRRPGRERTVPHDETENENGHDEHDRDGGSARDDGAAPAS